MVRERENSDDVSGEKSKDRTEFQKIGIDFLGEKSPGKIKMIGGFDEKAALHLKRGGNSSTQELTLSYLCDNSKLGFPEKDQLGINVLNSFQTFTGRYKGKEIVVSEDQIDENNGTGVVRDFLQLNESRGNLSKRESEYVETELENNKGKKPKVESLNLSLAPPDVSLSLAGSNRVNGDFPSMLRQSRSLLSLEPSFNNNAQTTYSNDFTASYTSTHPHSHNPSCSLTHNCTENYDNSFGSYRRDCDKIWNGGEGTNGSVHSRFRPIGDGTVAFSGLMGNRSVYNNDSCNNSLFKTASSENNSFFPSELPARPRAEAQSGDSRGWGPESYKGSEDLNVKKVSVISTAERIVREVVFESVHVMAQVIQELTDETVQSAKEFLKSIIVNPARKDELLGLQKQLERRSDLTHDTLTKCQKPQIEILVAIKTGLDSFLSTKIPNSELVEIFLLERCRNVNCRRALPVDDCDCNICSTKKGFCSECMCPVCLNFDCANNTCSWVGCDVCSHWCHAACGLQKNLIRPGPSLKGLLGITEMQFHCLGCGHASEMFGFVKDVFLACAKEWGLESLVKELDGVRKVFRGSEDRKGKELHLKADEMLVKLENKMITPSEVCSFVINFFNYAAGLSDLECSRMPTKDFNIQTRFANDASVLQLSNPVTPKFYNMNSSSAPKEFIPFDLHHNEIKFSNSSNKIIEDEWSVKPVKPAKKNNDGFDSLASLVRVKEAEARMFQSRADEAQREVEGFKRMVIMQTEKLEQEYAEKLAKLCLKETEEKQRKKVEELKALENSHGDYYNMKIRMQSEISGLLKRMEATKQQIV